MTEAFVLVNCVLGGEHEVLKKIREIKEVDSSHIVYGAYDLILHLKIDDVNIFRDIVTNKIRKSDGVTSILILTTTD